MPWLYSIYENLNVSGLVNDIIMRCFHCGNSEPRGFCEEIPLEHSNRHYYVPVNTFHTPDDSSSIHTYMDRLFLKKYSSRNTRL